MNNIDFMRQIRAQKPPKISMDDAGVIPKSARACIGEIVTIDILERERCSEIVYSSKVEKNMLCRQMLEAKGQRITRK